MTEFYLMKGNRLLYQFVFTMDVLSLTRRPTTLNTWVVTALKQILTSSFITVGIFALVVP